MDKEFQHRNCLKRSMKTRLSFSRVNLHWYDSSEKACLLFCNGLCYFAYSCIKWSERQVNLRQLYRVVISTDLLPDVNVKVILFLGWQGTPSPDVPVT